MIEAGSIAVNEEGTDVQSSNPQEKSAHDEIGAFDEVDAAGEVCAVHEIDEIRAAPGFGEIGERHSFRFAVGSARVFGHQKIRDENKPGRQRPSKGPQRMHLGLDSGFLC
jgi:hypothetical protein